jgi:hypothetical protein
MAQQQQWPETGFEQMGAEARDKERLDRQKMLVSLPKSKEAECYLASVAGKNVDLREGIEDLLLVVAAMEAGDVRTRLVQGMRGILDQSIRLHKMAVVAAKDGMDIAQKVFNPAPNYLDLEDEESKLLEKMKKERDAAKKKEANADKSGWKGLSAKRTTPYSYGYGGKTGFGYGSGQYSSGAGNLGSWAIQQLLSQQLGGQQSSGKGTAPAAAGAAGSSGSGGSGQQSGAYAAKIAMARLQYPCHNCGIMGHWKKDGVCDPADVAAHIKRKMQEQKKKEEEEDAEQGMYIYRHFD